MSKKIAYSEIFHSIQGEGAYTGRPTAWMRFFLCNLQCDGFGQKDRLVTIVVDSVAAASTKKELEADYDKDGYATDKSIIISKAMRKITNMIGRQKITLVFTNQLRQKMNAMAFADPWTTSGGKALAFHASVRLRSASTGKIKAKDERGNERIVGIKVRANVIKNTKALS